MLNFLKTLFIKKKPVVSAAEPVQTAPLTDEQMGSIEIPHVYNPPQILVGTSQSVGVQRDHNEDTLYALSSVLAEGKSAVPFGIFIVADGMGGHQYGEIASGVAARTMSEYILSGLYLPYLSPNGSQAIESMQELMEKGVREAQQAVRRHAPGGGTTLTAVVILGEQVTYAHVGDSRAYLVHPEGRLVAITQDHSLVRRLVELGQITEEQAINHPNKNVLYRALGQTEPVTPEMGTRQLPHPGGILICSDGLWGVVPEDQILDILKKAANPSLACQELVDAANQAGGPDNISVILIQYL